MVLDQIESSSIVALSLATGEVQWTTPRSETDAWATPVLYERAGSTPQIVTAGGGQYGAHALGTGERLWTHKGLAPAIVASPVVVGDTVVGFGYGYDSHTAVFRRAGKKRWRQGRPALARGVRRPARG